jgi:hypothetical protein
MDKNETQHHLFNLVLIKNINQDESMLEPFRNLPAAGVGGTRGWR